MHALIEVVRPNGLSVQSPHSTSEGHVEQAVHATCVEVVLRESATGLRGADH
jgi:hypothetical protein